MKRFAVSIAYAALLAAPTIQLCRAGDDGRESALTIYSSAAPGAIAPGLYRDGGGGAAIPGYAVVREIRSIPLQRGDNSVRFSDVAALIDPTTVGFESLTDAAGTRVLEQNFQFDLVGSEKLLRRYVDRKITVEQTHGDRIDSYTGTLLSTNGGIVLARDDGSVQMLQSPGNVTLPELPGGLITRPTLVWRIDAQRTGTHRARVSYQTGGLAWWADYNLVYAESARGDANACTLEVGAWVSIVNQSGAGYDNARLKLIAGDVQRAQPQPYAGLATMEDRAVAAPAPPAISEKSFFEYHLYTLAQPTTLGDNSTKQVELFPAARGVPCQEKLVYYGAPGYFSTGLYTDRDYGTQSNKKIDVYLSFKNAPENRMGMPLPAGRVRVSKRDDADQALEFIGEDVIDHTPRDETVLIKLGSAFDVVGERRQTNFSVDTARKVMSEDIEVKLRNHKHKPVTVTVKENLYRWTNWKITAQTHDYEKQDARTVHFPVRVAAEGEATLRYTVRYSW